MLWLALRGCEIRVVHVTLIPEHFSESRCISPEIVFLLISGFEKSVFLSKYCTHLISEKCFGINLSLVDQNSEL